MSDGIVAGNKFRMKQADFPDVEKCLVKWFTETGDKSVPLGGLALQKQAKKFALSLGHNNFNASQGWLANFKKRYEIVGKAICGESGSVDDAVCEEWNKNLPTIILSYAPHEIYNADETGLFYKCLPNKTLEFKSKPCHGGKMSKERLSILFTSNMTGSHKLLPLVIGKSKKPRCFKNIKSFPTAYNSNSKAWMTGSIFSQFLIDWDKQLTKKKKKALLFIDNCTAHSVPRVLTSLRVEFLPAQTTSKLQPMDAGIIKNFKVKYRSELVDNLLQQLDDGKAPTPIDVLQAMRFTRKAWDDVTPRTIANCFAKCSFKIDPCSDTVSETDDDFDDEDSSSRWSTVAAHFGVPDISFEEYINVDEDIIFHETPRDEEIIKTVIGTEEHEEDDDDNDDYDSEAVPSLPPPLTSDAMMGLNVVRRHLECLSEVDPEVFTYLNRISNAVTRKQISRNLSQTTVDNYILSVIA